jgi:hypothetical protein
MTSLHKYKKNVTTINVKLKLKIDLFLFLFQNSVYDLSNCCVTLVRLYRIFQQELTVLMSANHVTLDATYQKKHEMSFSRLTRSEMFLITRYNEQE